MDSLGYVPFDAFWDGVFDMEKISKTPNYCFKCEESFEFLGVDSNLNYIAGRCACIYDR